MKLKQRVIMLLILFVFFLSLFLMGMQLSLADSKIAPNLHLDAVTIQRPPATVQHNLSNQHEIHTNKEIHDNHSNLKTYGLKMSSEVASKDPWEIWRGWVAPNFLYPNGSFYSEEMNHILASMASSPITAFDVGHKGTQLKATVMLGKQRTVFKPKRYERDHVISGDPYAGFDRHNGEIAGFHLDGILGFRIAPPVVGRILNLTQLKPITANKLLKTYFNQGTDVCFYGVCYYCKLEEAACGVGEMMEGSLTLWLPTWYQLTTRRHPYQRTYKKGMKARWETNKNFCQSLLQPSSDYYHGILEFTDTAIYDFLMGNADRHHYEVYSKSHPHGRLLHIDNGKTFGNHGYDEMSILAPLQQCCRVRQSTWERLNGLLGSKDGPLSQLLERSMLRDPLQPILTVQHLQAMDRRHSIIMETIESCITRYSRDVVIVQGWPGDRGWVGPSNNG